MNTPLRTTLLFALAVAVAGCSSIGQIQSSHKELRSNAGEAETLLRDMRTQDRADEAFRVHEDRQWVPTNAVQPTERSFPQAQCSITLEPKPANSGLTLPEVAQAISEVCGVPVRITQDATRFLNGGYSGREGGGSSGGEMSAPPLVPSIAGPGRSMSFGSSSPRIPISYRGRLTGLLDTTAGMLDLGWRYKDGIVSFYYLDHRMFRIHSIPTETTLESIVQSGTNSGAGGGGGGGVSGVSGSQQSTTVSLSTNVREDLRATVESMLTPNVGRMSLASATGMLAITDTPAVLDRIGLFIDSQNVVLTQQLLLNVKVVSVTMRRTDSYGLNWEAIYSNVARNYGIGLVSAWDADPNAVAGSVNILQGSRRWAGSNALLEALAQEGEVSIVADRPLMTLNMQSAPMQVATQTGYAARVTTQVSQDVGALGSIEPGSVTAGFNLTVLPHILPNGRDVLLHISLNLSQLDELRRFTSGDSAIEIPDLSQSIFSGQVKLTSGDTLVIGGIDQKTLDNRRRGVGSPWNSIFGGGMRQSSKREIFVIIITPVVHS